MEESSSLRLAPEARAPRSALALGTFYGRETARRSLLFENPGLTNHGTTHTLLMGIQMIKPGERACDRQHQGNGHG